MQVAGQYLSHDAPVESAIIHGSRHLQQCYASLAADSFFGRDNLRVSAISFARQYVALQQKHADMAGNQWAIKPKLHLMPELARKMGQPSLCWTYRDEDFGGVGCATGPSQRRHIDASCFFVERLA